MKYDRYYRDREASMQQCCHEVLRYKGMGLLDTSSITPLARIKSNVTSQRSKGKKIKL